MLPGIMTRRQPLFVASIIVAATAAASLLVMATSSPPTDEVTYSSPYFVSFTSGLQSPKTILWAAFLGAVLPAIMGILFAILVRIYHVTITHKANKYPPKPSGLFLLGELPVILSFGFSLYDAHLFRQHLHKAYGKIVSIYGPVTVLLRKAFLLGQENDLVITYVSEPSVVKDLMTDKLGMHQERIARAIIKSLPWYFTEGMLGLPMGDEWRLHRRLLSPLFSENCLRAYAEVINEKAHVLCRKWREDCAVSTTQKVCDGLIRVTLDIIGVIGFGKEFNSVNDPSCRYIVAGKRVLLHTIRCWTIPSYIRALDFKTERECRQGADVFLTVVDQFIKEFHAEKSEEKRAKAGEDSAQTVPSKKTNFLRTILEANETSEDRLSDSGVKAALMTMLVAGHESAAHTLSWALHFLAKTPEAQEKLREEVDRVMATPDSPILHDDVSQLLYTKACFYEALRIMPTVPMFPRFVKKDKKFQDMIIPKDSLTIIDTYSMARDPDSWDNPDEYDPERFIERAEDDGRILHVKSPETAGHKPFSFIPFGSGMRSCIGKRLAVNQGVTILAIILRNFQLVEVPSHDPGSMATVTLQPKNGIVVKLVPRN